MLFLSPAAAVGLFAGLHFEEVSYPYFAMSLLFGIGLTYGGFRST
jgi:hypothetical protein